MPFLSLLPIFKLLCFWNPSCRFAFIASVPFPSTFSSWRLSFHTLNPHKRSSLPRSRSQWVSPGQMLFLLFPGNSYSLIFVFSGSHCPRFELQKWSKVIATPKIKLDSVNRKLLMLHSAQGCLTARKGRILPSGAACSLLGAAVFSLMSSS